MATEGRKILCPICGAQPMLLLKPKGACDNVKVIVCPAGHRFTRERLEFLLEQKGESPDIHFE